jgi:hypothetical protein
MRSRFVKGQRPTALPRVRRLVAIGAVLLSAAGGGSVLAALPASASVGQNPVNCANPTTWAYTYFNIGGDTVLVELRHSYACDAGWARLTRTAGNAPIAVSLSAWNPGQASQYTVPNTNYTYTVNASPGSQVCGGFQAWTYNQYGAQVYAGWHFAGCYST